MKVTIIRAPCIARVLRKGSFDLQSFTLAVFVFLARAACSNYLEVSVELPLHT